MSDIDPKEILTDEEYAETFESEETEMPPAKKSSAIKTVALMSLVAILAVSIGFLITQAVRQTGQPKQELSDLTSEPEVKVNALYFSEESRWHCLIENEIVGCETPHTRERHYFHFADAHGEIDNTIVEQAKNKTIEPKDFCVAWFAANSSLAEKLLDESQTSIIAEAAPTGIFCDVTFEEPVNTQAFTFDTKNYKAPEDYNQNP